MRPGSTGWPCVWTAIRPFALTTRPHLVRNNSHKAGAAPNLLRPGHLWGRGGESRNSAPSYRAARLARATPFSATGKSRSGSTFAAVGRVRRRFRRVIPRVRLGCDQGFD